VKRDGIIADGKYVEWLGVKMQQVAAEMPQTKMQQAAAKFSHQPGDELEKSNRHQPSGELNFPDIFALVPWKHHVYVVSKSQSVDEALFYIKQTIANNWSLADLEHEIKTDLYARHSSALTNFSDTMTLPQQKCSCLNSSANSISTSLPQMNCSAPMMTNPL
jgi:hypothetical protein